MHGILIILKTENLIMNNMDKKIKVFVVGNSIGYANWIPNRELVSTMEECDLVLFTGGEDVNPKYYNQPAHQTTSFNNARDIKEIKAFNEAKSLNKHILGICRGAQLACGLIGGKLVQHMENNDYTHLIKTSTGEEITVTSLHHQAQYPFDLPESDYKILGWSENESRYHFDGYNKEMNPPKECEIVYYPKIKCLGIQSHPEMCYPPHRLWEKTMIDYMQELVIKLLKNEL